MKTRNGGVVVSNTPGSATSPVLRRSLRPHTPRQDAGAQGVSSGEAGRLHASSRVTRSSASSTRTSSTNGGVSPQLTTSLPFRTPVGSHSKRAVSPDSSTSTRRSKRTRHSSGFYNDDSEGDTDADYASLTGLSLVAVEHTGSPRKSNPRSARRRKQTPTRQTLRAGQLVIKPKEAATPEVATESSPNGAFSPSWASLPYFVWLQILEDASSSLEDSHRAKWLLAASTTCRAFAEPAMTALYRRPPLATRGMAHSLVSLLARDPRTTLFNYRVKIERLCIDVNEIASKLHKGSPLDFMPLVRHLPRLKSIELYHWKDDAVMRDMGSNLRWRYPDRLFKSLEKSGARLGEWRWNRRFTEHAYDWFEIKLLHQNQLSSLKKLTFLNYQLPSLEATSRDDEVEVLERDNIFIKGIADAISALPDLEHIVFEYSNAVDDRLLSMLPKNLKALDLINCCEVTDDDLAGFLLTHGHKLESLTLRHNRALSLSWLTILGRACPHLEHLHMDYKIIAQIELGYRNISPTCDVLERFDNPPIWPTTLASLELKDFKHWTAEAADVFFQSLVDSAPNLLRLREIDLKVMLDVPYQKRSDFRDKWSNTLKKVFLRDDFNDDTGITSLRAPPSVIDKTPPLLSASSAKKARRRKAGGSTVVANDSPSRRSSRIAEQYSNPSSRASSVGRDLRGVGEKGFSYAEPDTDDDDLMPDEEEAGGEGIQGDEMMMVMDKKEGGGKEEVVKLFRQGMCDKVEVVLDNGKPVAMPYSMNDFVDEGSEGDDDSDEDWDGDGGEGEDEGYAW
ncbi:hypothetical protein QBC36DRAFT_234136 [Triangularia setosa]|uniref:Uncharacterized protein n=1 Tax=Triangularia setosa TaxID=2587417 RepID=A0AAN7A9Y8_9PEZI|nr:hypothetical protein QBC36DRAFT_234136 [Podospora setosa]